MKRRVFVTITAAVFLAACAHDPGFTPGSQLTLLNADQLPPPDGVVAGGPGRLFRIGPFDKLTMTVYGIPELSQSVQVDAAGQIAAPLVGRLNAAGSTPEELSRRVEAGLRVNHVRNPRVTVNIDETASQVVTIDGQVAEPGVYPVVGRMTLVRAIASAKGTNEFAKLEDVVVFRKVGNQQLAALYNLDAIRRGAYADPEIYANDTIVVGDSPSRRRFRDIITASPLIVAPVIALLNRGI